MGKLEIKTGQQFGRLTIIKEVEKYYSPNGQSKRQFLCKCECNTKKIILLNDLNRGKTTSCGCKIKEGTHKTHGLTYHPLYNTWENMKKRCYNKKTHDYKHYGARGITVCDRWLNSFSNFLEDMGEKPGPEYSIDRIDNNKGYSPENCCWATKSQQMKNRRKWKRKVY